MANYQAWDLNLNRKKKQGSRSNAKYHDQEFVGSSRLRQEDTMSMDLDLKPSPLHIRRSAMDSYPAQPPQSAVGDSTYTMNMWKTTSMPLIDSLSVSDQTFEDFSPTSVPQGMHPSSFEFQSAMNADCFSANGGVSNYPDLHQGAGDPTYATTLCTQMSPIGPFPSHTGLAFSPQSSMFGTSPGSSDSRIYAGETYSPVSPFSSHSSQRYGSASGHHTSFSSTYSGMEQQYNTSGTQSLVGSDWGANTDYPHPHPHASPTTTSRVRTTTVHGGKGGATQQTQQHQAPLPENDDNDDDDDDDNEDDGICCPDCGWTPPSHPKRTERQRQQSVNKHRHRRHSGVTHPCPVSRCGTTFTRMDNIKPHVRRAHPEFLMRPAPREAGAGKSRRSLGGKRKSSD